jgi:hypothetical protein
MPNGPGKRQDFQGLPGGRSAEEDPEERCRPRSRPLRGVYWAKKGWCTVGLQLCLTMWSQNLYSYIYAILFLEQGSGQISWGMWSRGGGVYFKIINTSPQRLVVLEIKWFLYFRSTVRLKIPNASRKRNLAVNDGILCKQTFFRLWPVLMST